VNRLVLPSFAKVNWILKILGPRPDGFHEILTILQTIDLHDELTIERTAQPGIQLELTGRRVDGGPANLVYRATQLFFEHTGLKAAGARLLLDKRVPIAAGLGGGSSNAATALLGLNRLWGNPLAADKLHQLAATLGSDVPFFLTGGTVLASGRGEKLEPLQDAENEEFLLLYPNLRISTAEAYGVHDRLTNQTPAKLTTSTLNNKIARFRERVEKHISVVTLVENDFDESIMPHFSPLADAARQLREADCQKVALCGSGSTLLGLAELDVLHRIARSGALDKSGEVYLCQTIPRRQYQDAMEPQG